MKDLLRAGSLHTVCEEARCPNIGECFKHEVATFMILGDVCTRNCRFCGVRKGNPSSPDRDEPQRLREAVETLQLRHVVITSPTRDDARDGGAGMFAQTIDELRTVECVRTIEVLIPDFSGNKDALKTVVRASPDIIAHNIETVPSLYPAVRSGADYRRSLDILSATRRMNPDIFAKSGLMLGLGEKGEEIRGALKDLRDADCDFLSIGQYLPPSKGHYPCEYIPPDEFAKWEKVAYEMRFKSVKSAPYVRSSYLAHEYLCHPTS